MIGSFSVKILTNDHEYVLRRAISAFLTQAGRDDLLLLHLACHGVKDEDGMLYFATSDTETDGLQATAIPADFINAQMNRSRSRRIVLLLDCCYSGAFARGMSHRADPGVQLKERFQGSGRVVLTASNSMEYAWEGEDLIGTGERSVFTSALVRGLEEGEADLDRDGQVSVDELYDYVFERVRRETPNQTPGKWSFDVAGDLYIARTKRGAEPAPLPDYVLDALASPVAHVRLEAVKLLRDLLTGSRVGIALTAKQELMNLVDDDSRTVSMAAAEALSRATGPTEQSQVPTDTALGQHARTEPVPVGDRVRRASDDLSAEANAERVRIEAESVRRTHRPEVSGPSQTAAKHTPSYAYWVTIDALGALAVICLLNGVGIWATIDSRFMLPTIGEPVAVVGALWLFGADRRSRVFAAAVLLGLAMSQLVSAWLGSANPAFATVDNRVAIAVVGCLLLGVVAAMMFRQARHEPASSAAADAKLGVAPTLALIGAPLYLAGIFWAGNAAIVLFDPVFLWVHLAAFAVVVVSGIVMYQPLSWPRWVAAGLAFSFGLDAILWWLAIILAVSPVGLVCLLGGAVALVGGVIAWWRLRTVSIERL
jgi:Caspase domain